MLDLNFGPSQLRSCPCSEAQHGCIGQHETSGRSHERQLWSKGHIARPVPTGGFQTWLDIGLGFKVSGAALVSPLAQPLWALGSKGYAQILAP